MARLKWNGDKIAAEVEAEANRALYKAGEYLLDEANKIAPKDEGTLIQTSGVSVGNAIVSIYYTQKYAPRLHEHPEYDFQNGRQGKWLEKTVLGNHEKVNRFLKKEMEKAFGGG